MKLSWISIIRLGLVQMALGAIVVLMTSTLNRLMVVELTLAASLPGALVAFHYAIQITRPNWGFLSDTGGERTKFIIGGMGVLAVGGVLAAAAIWVLETMFWAGLGLNIVAYALIGLGVGASGTSLLALLATATDPRRRAAAATITWLMMIFGIAVTATVVGKLLDPYSAQRLVQIVGVVAIGAVGLTCLSVSGIERNILADPQTDRTPFTEALRQIWAEDHARNFTIFVFLSMTAYFMQELILEPYAGLVFNFTPGQTTSMSGAQNGGAFMGMVTVGLAVSAFKFGTLRNWVVAGCLGSAGALCIIALMGRVPEDAALLLPAVITLGFFNGMFAVAAIGAMMALAGRGQTSREGTRMGLWGAAQAMAAGFGGLAGATAVDLLRLGLGHDATAFEIVFLFEAVLFLLAAGMALRIIENSSRQSAALVPGE
ncbi:BCD family MFS transporter [Actibacterium sp. 188UL27-1]|uniref:BCD family MFS transporter n=1 Tax=Actibacterium sp. 188UL27-1 TaxID=2786961 RepID=UPI00195A8DEA|nr:BCD family MFS transporter [Actibacterium sp. 188UL27-1]MBM7068610.1 BCD family MFS transporter [Actibacterium sp. 188UL27-1]